MAHHNTAENQEKPQNIYRNMYHGTSNKFSATSHVFFLWKGSCYQLIWRGFLIWCVLYASISAMYRNIFLHEIKARQTFELICVYAENYSSLIPITFLTGFYVSQVVSRWWDQFMSLPWPDSLALKMAAECSGTDEFHRNLRRTVVSQKKKYLPKQI